MEVHLSPEQEQRLSRLAAQQGRDVDALAQLAIGRYLEEEARFIEAVKLGEDALDRGEYLTHEDVGERLERLFKS
jgi:predicted transcriptional regulator